MEFSKINSKSGLLFSMIGNNGLIHIGINRVLFGYRIRAGFISNQFSNYEIDWCAGADIIQIRFLYSALLNILSQREENKLIFNGIPTYSKIKPFFNDPEFVQWLSENIKGELKILTINNTELIENEII